MKNIARLVIVICFAALPNVATLAQKKAVPPPPKPANNGPSLNGTAQFLQNKLKSIGRVSWNLTTHNTKTGESIGPTPAWEEVASLVINPRNCEMKVQWNASQGSSGNTFSFFLEEMGKPEALPSQDSLNRVQPDVEHTVSPAVYSVTMPGMGDFKVPDQQTARQIASSFAHLITQCKVIPHTTAMNGPTLEETLSFIEDKLNTQGAVNWLSTFQDTVANTSHAPTQVTTQISSVAADPGTCRINYHWKVIAVNNNQDSTVFVNLRRVEKLEVMGMQESIAKGYARQGHPEYVESISPVVYQLVVTGAGNRSWYFPFADDDLANRVAKAMVHAVELCGGGDKDPFAPTPEESAAREQDRQHAEQLAAEQARQAAAQRAVQQARLQAQQAQQAQQQLQAQQQAQQAQEAQEAAQEQAADNCRKQCDAANDACERDVKKQFHGALFRGILGAIAKSPTNEADTSADADSVSAAEKACGDTYSNCTDACQ